MLSSMDRFSQLPDDVIDRILCSLPLLDAVKTCVLAKAWRHKWVTLSKLQFDYLFWQEAHKGYHGRMYMPGDLVILVTNVLLQHIGVLDELHLSFLSSFSENISPLMQFALRKGVKTLSLKECAIPACVLSSTQLTSLELEPNQHPFSLPTSFEGLPNLVSLKLHLNDSTGEDADKIMHFISCCPKIKTVVLYIDVDKELKFRATTLEYLSVCGQFPLICFQETESLKELDICVSDALYLRYRFKCGDMNFFFNGLDKLEHLKLTGNSSQLFFAYCDPIPRRLSKLLGQLKILELEGQDLHGSDVLRALLCLVASSPKLCKLIIDTIRGDPVDEETEMEMISCIDSYRDQKFENLHTVEVISECSEFDIKVIGLLLGCSPNLEMMSISFPQKTVNEIHMDMVSFFSEEVMRFTPASTKARVEFL